MTRLLIEKDDGGFVGAALAQGAVYSFAAWLVLGRNWSRTALGFIISVAVLARAIALASPATLSTDVYRYIWDGRVQAAGINPYRYVPSDERLASLRDEEVYPNVSRKDSAFSIYPPVAQIIFFAASRVGETFTVMRLAVAGFDIITIAAIVMLLVREGRQPARVLIYAWHPLPIWEFSAAGHIDAAAIALMCIAMLVASHGWRGSAGVALAASVLVKPFALVVAPALWRPWDWRMAAAFIAAFGAFYLPYLSAGWRVFGGAGGYVDEELYRDGAGFFFVALLRALGLPSPSGRVFATIAIAILCVSALCIAFRPRSGELRQRSPIVLGTMLMMLISPHYTWYFAWLLPLLCRIVYLPLLYLTLACMLLYVPPIMILGEHFEASFVVYGGAAVLILVDLGMRNKRRYLGHRQTPKTDGAQAS